MITVMANDRTHDPSNGKRFPLMIPVMANDPTHILGQISEGMHLYITVEPSTKVRHIRAAGPADPLEFQV